MASSSLISRCLGLRPVFSYPSSGIYSGSISFARAALATKSAEKTKEASSSSKAKKTGASKTDAKDKKKVLAKKASAVAEKEQMPKMKRPPTGFNLFVAEQMVDVGEAYKQLHPSERQKYEEKAAPQRQKYDALLQEQKANRVKRPPNQWALYLKDRLTRESRPGGMKQTEFFKIAAQDYRKLDENERSKYATQAHELRTKYHLQRPRPEAEPKRAPSAYSLYVQEQTTNWDGPRTKESLKKIAHEWKGMSEKDKLTYQRIAADKKAKMLAAKTA